MIPIKIPEYFGAISTRFTLAPEVLNAVREIAMVTRIKAADEV